MVSRVSTRAVTNHSLEPDRWNKGTQHNGMWLFPMPCRANRCCPRRHSPRNIARRHIAASHEGFAALGKCLWWPVFRADRLFGSSPSPAFPRPEVVPSQTFTRLSTVEHDSPLHPQSLQHCQNKEWTCFLGTNITLQSASTRDSVRRHGQRTPSSPLAEDASSELYPSRTKFPFRRPLTKTFLNLEHLLPNSSRPSPSLGRT